MEGDTTMKRADGRYKCRHSFCPNRYDDVIGGDNAFGKHKAGAVCVPCLYAEQMVHQGLSIERVEAVPHLMEMFVNLLGNTGWTWQHVKDSFRRMEQHA
jgi:hypothetical protein